MQRLCNNCRRLTRAGFFYCRVCQKIRRDSIPHPSKEEMVEKGLVRLTNRMFQKGRCITGGWNRQQIEALGGKWASGEKLVGRYITPKQYDEFLSLRNTHLKKS